MAAPIIKLKRSAVEGKIPSTANVPLGELALNTYDGYLYASKDVGAGVTVIAINPWRVGTGTDAYNAYFTQGNVGIGSTLPTELLDVSGTTQTQQLNVSGISTFTGSINLPDSSGNTVGRVLFGDGNDLEIYHNGTNSVIKDSGTGNLFFISNAYRFRNAADNEQIANFTENSSVELFYDNGKKFETTGAGVTVFGTTQTQQLNVSGISTFQDNIHLLDSDKLLLGGAAGTHDGLEIYHDGSHSYIDDSGTGNLKLRSNNFRVSNADESKMSATFVPAGAVELYNNHSKKFETTGAGVTVTGTTFSNQLNVSGLSTFAGDVSFGSTVTFGDNDQIILGDGPDLKIYHDGSNSYVEDTGTGALIMKGTTLRFRSTQDEKIINAHQNGSVDLFYDNFKKLETTGYGVSVTGHTETDTLNVSGIATAAFYYGDGSNLTNITASASPGGSDGQVQYNNGGATAGTSNIYFDDTNNRLGIGITDPDSILESVSSSTDGVNAHLGGEYTNDGSVAVRRIEFSTKNYRNSIQSQQGSGGNTFSSDNDLLLNPSGGNIGIGENAPDHKLHIQGNIGLRDHAVVGTVNNVTTTSTTQTAVASLSASTYRSVEFTVQATEGTKYHVIKVLVIHNGSEAHNTQYGEMFFNSSVFSLDADISGGNIRLLGTSASANSTVYKVSFQGTKV